MNKNKLTKKELIIQLLATITIFIINWLIAVLICKHFNISNRIIIGYSFSTYPITFEFIIWVLLIAIELALAYLLLPKEWLKKWFD